MDREKVNDLAKRIYDTSDMSILIDPDYTVETVIDTIENSPLAVIEYLVEMIENIQA